MTQFQVQIDKFVRKAKAAPGLVVRKVAIDMLTGIVMKTPVGNPDLWKNPAPAGYVGGRARASWGVGLNRPDPNNMTVTLIDKDGNRTIAQGTAKLSSWRPDDSIWIASNLPYIERLEYGHSGQAPHGMVRLTIAEWNSYLADAVRKLPN